MPVAYELASDTCYGLGVVTLSLYYYKGSQVSSYLALVSRSVLVLSQPSDVAI